MLERGFLRDEKHRDISGKQMSLDRRYARRGLSSGAKVPVYSGVALIIVSVILILVFFGRPFIGILTVGVFAGVVSIYLGLMANGFFNVKRKSGRY